MRFDAYRLNLKESNEFNIIHALTISLSSSLFRMYDS